MTLRWACAGVFAGTMAGALLAAPAAWLAPWVEQASGARLRLLEPTGTVWAGLARLAVADGAGGQPTAVLPGALSWRITADWNAIQLSVQADCCMAEPLLGHWTPHWGGWSMRISDAQSRWPASLLAGLGAPWNTMRLEGELRLTTESLVIGQSSDRGRLQGAAQLDALDISSQLSTLQPLGSYRLRVAATPGPGAPALNLQTLQGALQLSGSGQWLGSHWRFTGEASAAPDSEAVLGNLLNIVGRRQGAKSVITSG